MAAFNSWMTFPSQGSIAGNVQFCAVFTDNRRFGGGRTIRSGIVGIGVRISAISWRVVAVGCHKGILFRGYRDPIITAGSGERRGQDDHEENCETVDHFVDLHGSFPFPDCFGPEIILRKYIP